MKKSCYHFKRVSTAGEQNLNSPFQKDKNELKPKNRDLYLKSLPVVDVQDSNNNKSNNFNTTSPRSTHYGSSITNKSNPTSPMST